jgi:hypothetical protein
MPSLSRTAIAAMRRDLFRIQLNFRTSTATGTFDGSSFVSHSRCCLQGIGLEAGARVANTHSRDWRESHPESEQVWCGTKSCTCSATPLSFQCRLLCPCLRGPKVSCSEHLEFAECYYLRRCRGNFVTYTGRTRTGGRNAPHLRKLISKQDPASPRCFYWTQGAPLESSLDSCR